MLPISLLAVVLGFCSLFRSPASPAEHAAEKIVLTALVLGVLWALGAWAAAMRQHLVTSQRSLDRCQRWLHGAYLAALLAIFGPFEFARIASINGGGRNWLAADDLGVLAMIVVPIAGLWLLWARAASLETGLSPGLVVQQSLRQVFLLPLLPVLGVACLDDTVRLARLPDWVGSLGTLALLAAFVSALPWLLRYVWPAHRLPPGPARACIEATLWRCGVHVADIYCWETHGLTCNAAVAGLLPGFRYLFVTDALLSRLTTSELAAITAHEAAHLRHRHLPRLALTLAAPLLGLLWLTQLCGASDAGPTPVAVLLGLVVWIGCHRRWAHAFEHQADLTACRPRNQHVPCPQAIAAFQSALATAAGSSAGDWLHPKPADRVQFLHHMASSPQLVRRFERKLIFWSCCQFAISFALLAALWRQS